MVKLLYRLKSNLAKKQFILGKFDNSFPKFRLTGTIPDGDVYPVIFQNEVINVDAVLHAVIKLIAEVFYV